MGNKTFGINIHRLCVLETKVVTCFEDLIRLSSQLSCRRNFDRLQSTRAAIAIAPHTQSVILFYQLNYLNAHCAHKTKCM